MFNICGRNFYTDETAGKLLGCTARTVRTLIKENKLKGFTTVGGRGFRVWETDLLEYLESKQNFA